MDKNECRALEVPAEFSLLKSQSGISEFPLEIIYRMQKTIQEDVYNYNFEQMREHLSHMSKFFLMNYEAIQDEFREFRVAMGGVDSHGSALWKPWKAKHMEAELKPFAMLTPEEVLELKFEWIDMLHFFMNLAIMIGLTPQEMLDMYIAKNQENIDRQNRGY